MVTPALELRAAALGHRLDAPALRAVSLEVRAGERVAILGGNGAGKSTLLKSAVGLLPARGGEVRVFGTRVRGPRDAVLAGAGLLFQNPSDQLFGATVLEDAAYGPSNQGLTAELARSRARTALASCGLDHLAERHVEALSFGEQRRACLAGILAMEPKLLLLDEPTAGLDPEGELRVLELLRILAEAGVTLVAATHAVDLVPFFAERVVLLGEGRILADGPTREVFAEEQLLRRAHVRAPLATALWRALRWDRAGDARNIPLTVEEVAAWNATGS
jgi:cobalt/nickel transport system ATP-binding protein